MTAVGTRRSVVQILREEELPFMAASIAYYAIASVIPLLLIALAVLSAFGAVDALVASLHTLVSGAGAVLIDRVLADATGRGVVGGLGFLLALWSGSKVFRGLSIAFDQIYSRESDVSLMEQLKSSVLVMGLLFAGVVLLSATSFALAALDLPVPHPVLLGNVATLVVLGLGLLPTYYVMPPGPVSVRHAVPGTVFAAVGWVLLQVGFYYYAGASGKYAALGLLGAVLLFVTLLYLGAIVLLVGAVVNVALDL